MKLNISGSELESHLRPLRALVLNNEGINYDVTDIAVYEEDGCKLLTAMTHQPTYEVYMELNLSGNPAQKDEAVQHPIEAEANMFSECWELPYSVLSARNRSIGQHEASYEFKEDKLGILFDEKSAINLAVTHKDNGIIVPVYDYILEQKSLVTLHGKCKARDLARALYAPINVCALSTKAGNVKERAIHLNMNAEECIVEGLSATVQVSSYVDRDFKLDMVCQDLESMHVSISLPSAQILYEILNRAGDDVKWIYSLDDKSIIFWMNSYVIRLDADEMFDHQCEYVEPSDRGVRADRKSLWNALRRAKAAKASVALLVGDEKGEVSIITKDSSTVSHVQGKTFGIGSDTFIYHLPLDAMLSLLRGETGKEVIISFKGDKLVVQTNDIVVALVKGLND